jgi:hypothetical protein
VLKGRLASCVGADSEPAWCVGGSVLDFGAHADLRPVQQDYDADGTQEPVTVELQGLRGSQVRVRLDDIDVVDAINGLAYEVIPVGDDEPTTPQPTEPSPTEPTGEQPTSTEPTKGEPTRDGPSGDAPTTDEPASTSSGAAGTD